MCRVVCSGYAVLTVACLACSLCFVAPYWLYYPDGYWSSFTNIGRAGLTIQLYNYRYEGLFGWVDNNNRATWFWDNNFAWEKATKDWQRAAQGLFAAGLLLLLIGWSIATFHVCCCRCCKESFSITSALGSLALSGLVLIAASLVVYAVFAAKEFNAGYASTANAYYYWAFYVGIAGAAMGLIVVILFFCDGCRSRSHSGYHMTRVV